MLAAVVAALASCQSKANKTAEAEADSLAIAMTPITELTEVYEGTLPAADGPGIDYVLTLHALPVAANLLADVFVFFHYRLAGLQHQRRQAYQTAAKQQPLCLCQFNVHNLQFLFFC